MNVSEVDYLYPVTDKMHAFRVWARKKSDWLSCLHNIRSESNIIPIHLAWNPQHSQWGDSASLLAWEVGLKGQRLILFNIHALGSWDVCSDQELHTWCHQITSNLLRHAAINCERVHASQIMCSCMHNEGDWAGEWMSIWSHLSPWLSHSPSLFCSSLPFPFWQSHGYVLTTVPVDSWSRRNQ